MKAIPRVIILGGGLAGLAAALCLAETDFEVELIEQRSVLGGRASSFFPPGGAERIDNCQHVLLGCCTNLLDFFRRAGTAQHFRFYSHYLFLGPRGASKISAAALPAPLHLFPSLLRFRNLAWSERCAVARAMGAILRRGDGGASEPDQPMLHWLREQRQPPAAIENFWRVVLTSALNEDLERLSRRHALQVFRDGFLRNRHGYRMGVPAIPLSELYSSEILNHKCTVRLGTSAGALEISDGEMRGVRLRDGELRSADFYISTLLPDNLCSLLPPSVPWPEIQRFESVVWSPITGVHLWFDRPITSRDHAAVMGRTIQWVFNRSAIAGESAGRRRSPLREKRSTDPQYIQIVVSASRSLMTLRREELLAVCLKELGELFPQAKSAALLKSVVVKEARATLSPQPGIDALRPGPITPFRNFYLAGDWTATGWPFTMEGAVRSGYRAAELVAQAAGRPQTFLRPDLPRGLLVRLLGAPDPSRAGQRTFAGIFQQVANA